MVANIIIGLIAIVFSIFEDALIFFGVKFGWSLPAIIFSIILLWLVFIFRIQIFAFVKRFWMVILLILLILLSIGIISAQRPNLIITQKSISQMNNDLGFSVDTNASTICSSGEYLDGDGTCINVNSNIRIRGLLEGFNSTFNFTYDAKNSSHWLLFNNNLSYTNGNIGIGTTTPTHELNVIGDGNFTGGLFLGDDLIFTKSAQTIGTTSAGHTLLINPGSNLFLGTIGNGMIDIGKTALGTVTVYNDFAVDSNSLFIDASENKVGIGTRTPTHELNIVGNSNITGDLYLGDDAFITGDLGVGTTTPLAKQHVVGQIDGTMYSFNSAGDYRNEIENKFSASTPGANWMTFRISDSTTTGQVTIMTLFGDQTVNLNGRLSVKQGNAVASAKVGGIVHTNVTRSTVGTVVTETDMHTHSLSPQTLKVDGDYLDVHMSGYANNDDTGDIDVRIYFGGTLLTTINYPDNDAGFWTADFKVFRQNTTDQYIIGTKSGAGGSSTILRFQADTAIDDTGAIIIKATGDKSDSNFEVYQETTTISWNPNNI